ncbi:MAG: peptidoglycan-associated lipoprotein Pal [Candidatus Binatia bacterium]
MHNRLIPVFGFIFVAFLTLTGCTPAPVSKRELSSPARQRPTREARESISPSSLEAFRRGEEIPASQSDPIKDVYFDFDRYSLRPDARETLKVSAEWLRAHPSVRVEIEGHADERGTNEYNLGLGVKRAQAAKDYLATLGISPSRMSTVSYGEELPVCRRRTEECWQENRRAHSVVISAQPSHGISSERPAVHDASN